MSSRVFSGGRPGMFLGSHGKSIDIPIWLGQKNGLESPKFGSNFLEKMMLP